MDNKNEKIKLDDDVLDSVSGGTSWTYADAECDCPSCGRWMRPLISPDRKLICSLCWKQCGGAVSGRLY